MLLTAARRFLALLAVVGSVTVLGSLTLGALAGAPQRRALALGCYLVGSFLLLAAFFLGTKGVLRAESDPVKSRPLGFMAARRVRPASPAEQRESIGISTLIGTLGVVLLLVGIAADSENELV